MTTTLYDSTSASDIPADAPAVAGYVDGAFAWSASDWQRFSSVPRITITTRPPGIQGARVCDVENGDFTFDQGAAWAKSEVDAGRRPTLYFSVSNYDAITTALHNVGLTWAQVDAWGAHYGAPAVIPAGYVALQYSDPSTSGGHYDLSVASTTWLQGTPAPAPPPLPKEVTMASPLAVGRNASGVAIDIEYISADGHVIQATWNGTTWAVYDHTANTPVSGGFPAASTT